MALHYIHDITIDTDIIPAEVMAAFRDVTTNDDGKLMAIGRDAEREIRAWAARRSRPAAVETTGGAAHAAPLATEKQVNYIMRLIDRGAHEEGGFISGGPTTIDQVRRMTRRDASMYIDSLTSNY
ncbi:hypothetical protein [Brevibacterium otitidis]|uniref:Uncharacterized protein n=1 Tax=Brevibacterium otitidis TaxID=53364 RepID=A0ABV5X227_9MICO|nr:hypothetical protein GCM10023233_05110 [Brevibacterium otitidis]